MRESGNKIAHMGLGNMSIKMALYMKETGLMISSTEKGLRNGLTRAPIKDNTSMDLNTGMGLSCGKMDPNT
jgi:hypothetical protein